MTLTQPAKSGADLGAQRRSWPNLDDLGEFDVRKLCLARDILARHDGLADFSFAMQDLERGLTFGKAQKNRWLQLAQVRRFLCPDRARIRVRCGQFHHDGGTGWR